MAKLSTVRLYSFLVQLRLVWQTRLSKRQIFYAMERISRQTKGASTRAQHRSS